MKIRFFILLFAVCLLLVHSPSDFEAFAASPTDISATDTATDGTGGFTELDGATKVATFTIGSSTYAIVTGYSDSGVQIIDITNPSNISATDAATDDDAEDNEDNGEFTHLEDAYGVATFTIGSSTYAIVASDGDAGIQIIDISDPENISATDTATDDDGEFTHLGAATGIATFTIGSSTYAIVTGYTDNGVQIIDISDPENISATDTATDDDGEFTHLSGAYGVATFTIGSSTYAIVTGYTDNGVQIIDISDPENISATDAATDDDEFTHLGGAYGVATFTIGSSTYAIVASDTDNGVQIIDISDPENISATDTATDDDGEFTHLGGATGVATFTIGSSTYAIVTGYDEDAVQIIDISDPENISATDAATDDDNGEFTHLGGAYGVATFTIGSSTYAIVASDDDGVQIIDLNTVSPTVTITSSSGSTGDTVTSTTLSYTVTFSAFTSNFVVGDITVTGTANGGSPEASNFAGSGTTYTFDVVKGSSDGTVSVSVAAGAATDSAETENTVSNTYTLTIDTTEVASTGGTCSRHVILGNCGTIAINNDEYRIINTWTNVPTTEVLVGQPVTVTLSTPNNPTHTKIHFASVHTEVFSVPLNYEQSAHIDYSIMSDSYSVTKAKLFQVAAATHRITEDPDVKNLEMFEVVFTMIFAQPMDTSHVVVETKNKFGIPETLYLMSALKVNENLVQALTLEEKSKFSIVDPELAMKPLGFVDPEKDPSHYVKRYLTEPKYKEWFDRNFPTYTIYDAIGITFAEYQEIESKIVDPEPEMNPEPEMDPEPEPTKKEKSKKKRR